MKVFWDPVQLDHAPRFFLQRGQIRPHFEVPARAEALLDACRKDGLDITKPPAAPRDALERVHAPDYLDFLRTAPAEWAALPGAGQELVPNIHPTPEMIENGGCVSATVVGRLGWYSFDTASPISETTWLAAAAAAAGALAAAGEAAAGRHAYALARPPGHHAYRARAGGHCYLNNAALAAEALRVQGAARVAVLDIDSHHGNGTQGLFWHRGDVLFVSIHADPNRYYPWFVGHAEERGAGAGEGANLNLPLAFGTGDGGWLEALGIGLAVIRQFGADALVVSLGFDASEHEPLAALAVTSDGFARAGEAIGGLGLPTAIVQEGGYNVGLIGQLLSRFLAGFGVA
jgi:acetoin utilization deacetylase AcuC-like enzyme